ARAAFGPETVTGCPARRTSPSSGLTLPATILQSVLLPEPFDPIRTCTSPASRVRSPRLSAWVAPYALRTPRSSSSAMLVLGLGRLGSAYRGTRSQPWEAIRRA